MLFLLLEADSGKKLSFETWKSFLKDVELVIESVEVIVKKHRGHRVPIVTVEA